MTSNESMIEFVAQSSDFRGQLGLFIIVSLTMGLGNGGVPGFDSIATALVVATAPETIPGGLGYSVSLMVPILIIIDIYAAWLHRKRLDWPTIWQILPLSFVGMWIGQQMDNYMTDRSVRVLVGSILLCILVVRMKSKMVRTLPCLVSKESVVQREKDDQLETEGTVSLPRSATSSISSATKKANRPLAVISACVVGLFGGAASMLINSMGPILNVFLLSVRKLSPEPYVGTRAMFFCFLNISKLPLRFAAGTLGWPMIPLAAFLGMVAIVGVHFAKPIMKSLSEETFVKLELFFVMLCGFKLLLF